MKGTVIQVGDGRGFVIATKDARYVVTAAHCLANLPPADAAAYVQAAPIATSSALSAAAAMSGLNACSPTPWQI